MPKHDLNIPPHSDENAILRMEVELRDKRQPPRKQGKKQAKPTELMGGNVKIVEVCLEKVCGFEIKLLSYFIHDQIRYWMTC